MGLPPGSEETERMCRAGVPSSATACLHHIDACRLRACCPCTGLRAINSSFASIEWARGGPLMAANDPSRKSPPSYRRHRVAGIPLAGSRVICGLIPISASESTVNR